MTLTNFKVYYLFNNIWIHFYLFLFRALYSYEYFSLHFLCCSWLGYIRSYTEYSSHKLLISWWFVHSRLRQSIWCCSAHYLPIGGMTNLGHWDEIPMVSVMGTLNYFVPKPKILLNAWNYSLGLLDPMHSGNKEFKNFTRI